MPWNLLLLPLLGGYWATQRFNLTRFRAQQFESYRLLLESAIVGVLLVVAAKVLWLVPDCPSAIQALLARSLENLSFPCVVDRLLSPLDAQTAVTSTLLAGLLPEVGNWLVSPARAMEWNYKKYGDTLYELLGRAFDEELSVSLTLDSRKVYVGLLGQIPNLEPFDEYLKIIPYYSGYRDAESLVLDLQTSYIEVYRRMAEDEDGHLYGRVPEDFEVVIPVDSIKTASLFSGEIYDEIFAKQQESQRSLVPQLLTTIGSWWDQRER